MSKFDPQAVYLKLKKKSSSKYSEEIHCPMILRVMNTSGTMAAFCKEALISEGLFYTWLKARPLFNECYQLGKMVSKANWEKEGEEGASEEYFNWDYWRIIGACRYGIGQSRRVRMAVDATLNPYEQYQQLVKQANEGELTASELKQFMEAINIGIRAFEAFKLQAEMDEMKGVVNKLGMIDGHNSSTIEKTQETN